MGLDSWLHAKNKDGATTELHYWRKFNALHNFITTNAGKPDSNCENIRLGKGTIAKILNECVRIVDILGSAEKHYKHPEVPDYYEYGKDVTDLIGESILHPASGFFFGSTAIDKWYEEYIKETIPVMEDALKRIKAGERIYYHSWW